MGGVPEQLGEGRGSSHTGMNGQRNAAGRETRLEVLQSARIEPELGGDMHGQPLETGQSLLAFERLPQHLIRHYGMPFRMSGNADTANSRVLDNTAFEQFECAREGAV